MSKYIQSFYPYPVTFSSIGKTMPAKNADGELRNLIEMSDEEIDKLQKREPFFNQLLNLKKIRILNKMPESYKPAATQINEARAEAEAAKAELEKIKAQYGIKDEAEATEGQAEEKPLDKMSYKELEALAAEKGIEHKNSKKEYIEALTASAE
jgi:hypothetical protein